MPYVPDRGDVVHISFDPQAGREQAGRRPAFVLSPRSYNERVGLALFCPITRRVKGYSFEVEIPEGHPVIGVVLADQIKSLDWRARKVEPWCRLPVIYNEVSRKLADLVTSGF
jgi:mRNA interferase MazF